MAIRQQDGNIYCLAAILSEICPTESLNSVIRHAIKKRKVFPTDEAVKKVVWLAIQSASQKWTMPLKDWRMEMSRFIIKFSDRLDGHFWEKAFTQNRVQGQGPISGLNFYSGFCGHSGFAVSTRLTRTL